MGVKAVSLRRGALQNRGSGDVPRGIGEAMRRLVLAGATVVLAGCATTLSPEARDVRQAPPEKVDDCDYIGMAQGSSGFGNLASQVGMENARNEVREKAADMGGTDVVWVNVSGGFASSASGRVYDCS